MLHYTTQLCKASSLVSWERQWAWGTEAAEGPGEQNCFLHSSHGFFPCPQRGGRQAEITCGAPQRGEGAHPFTTAASDWLPAPPLLKSASHLSSPAPLWPGWHVSGIFLEEQSRIQQQVFNGVIQLKQYFQAESHFHVERQNWLSGAQCNLSAVYQSWEQSKATKTQMLQTVKQPEPREHCLLPL